MITFSDFDLPGAVPGVFKERLFCISEHGFGDPGSEVLGKALESTEKWPKTGHADGFIVTGFRRGPRVHRCLVVDLW